MKKEMLDLEGADEIEVRIAKRRDGFVVTLNGSAGLILQLSQIKGSVTVRDERAASATPLPPQSRLSAHPSAPGDHRERKEPGA
jgi:hypothetical protein